MFFWIYINRSCAFAIWLCSTFQQFACTQRSKQLFPLFVCVHFILLAKIHWFVCSSVSFLFCFIFYFKTNLNNQNQSKHFIFLILQILLIKCLSNVFVTADHCAAAWQAGAVVQPLPGGGQGHERQLLLRRLPLPHTQGDQEYTQLIAHTTSVLPSFRSCC